MKNDHTLTVKQAHYFILQSSEGTKGVKAVYQLCYRGRIDAIKTVDGIRISESSLREYLRDKRLGIKKKS